MKTNYFRGVAAVLIWSMVAGTGLGQSSDEPVPHDPLLPRAPDGSWLVTFKYKPTPAPSPSGSPASTPDRVATIRVEKKGTVYHVVTTKTSGLESENWCISGVEICKAERSKTFMRLSQDNPLYVDFSKTDFDELSWIGTDNYKGVKDGPTHSKVFTFEVKNVERRQTGQENASTGNLTSLMEQAGSLTDKREAGSKGASVKQAVSQFLAAQFGDTLSKGSIEVTTQLPVEYDDGIVDRMYTFSSTLPPNAPVDILQLMQVFREERRRTYVRASPP